MNGSTSAKQVQAALAFTNTFEIECTLKLEEKKAKEKVA
jgi:hypothetical protein